MGTSWKSLGDEANKSITMCANRNIFAVGVDGSIRMRGGVDTKGRRTPNFDTPYGLEWTLVPASPENYNIDQVSCGSLGKVWATNQDG